MHRGFLRLAARAGRTGSVCALLVAASAASPGYAWGRAGSTPASAQATCAPGAVTTVTSPAGVEGAPQVHSDGEHPSVGDPCWEEVNPYPFGSEGRPIALPTDYAGLAPLVPCREALKGLVKGSQCALRVTSMAFRAWNRGLAATTTPAEIEAGAEKNPYGVWVFNGTAWEPSIGFPGPKTCPGHKVIWAGKLDYWVYGGLGGAAGEWGPLCRFDGQTLEWQSFEMPESAQLRAAESITGIPGTGTPVTINSFKHGTMTSAACFAWNNCWFFGSYGVVLHWNGSALLDASPELSNFWPRSEYTAATGRVSPGGVPFGVAVGSVFEYIPSEAPEKEEEKKYFFYPPPRHDGSLAPEFYGSTGGPFSGLPTALVPESAYPGRTEWTGVEFDAEGDGWVAGGPTKKRWALGPFGAEAPPEEIPSSAAAPVPLVPISPTGARTSCQGPSERRFTFPSTAVGFAMEPRFLWTSIGVIPGLDEAIAGGVREPAKSSEHEPVIVQAKCDGQTSVTRFQLEVPELGLLPADREALLTVAAATNASNDGWVATEGGSLPAFATTKTNRPPEPPHLYRLTDGEPPDGAEGNDEEERPVEFTLEAPTVVLEPPPPAPPAPPPTAVTHTHHVKLPPAIFDVKAKLHGRRNLYLSFKVRREITLGAEGLRHGHVVAVARPRRFTGNRGVLVLKLDPKRWPIKVRFIA